MRILQCSAYCNTPAVLLNYILAYIYLDASNFEKQNKIHKEIFLTNYINAIYEPISSLLYYFEKVDIFRELE